LILLYLEIEFHVFAPLPSREYAQKSRQGTPVKIVVLPVIYNINLGRFMMTDSETIPYVG
jgi:hypothetical protein